VAKVGVPVSRRAPVVEGEGRLVGGGSRRPRPWARVGRRAGVSGGWQRRRAGDNASKGSNANIVHCTGERGK
jgi:hypothetical protein